jgi:hypothetical protein
MTANNEVVDALRHAADPLSRFGSWRGQAINDLERASTLAATDATKKAVVAAISCLQRAAVADEEARAALRAIGIVCKTPTAPANKRAYGRMRDLKDSLWRCQVCPSMVFESEREQHVVEHVPVLFVRPPAEGHDPDGIGRGGNRAEGFRGVW